MTTVLRRRQERVDTAANWASANPVLLDGELGYDKTADRMKVGDGVSAWSALDFVDAFNRSFQVNVRDPVFGGCKNDRSVDVSSVFQTALDALRSPISVGGSGSFNYQNWYGGTLHVPGGIYKLSSTIGQTSATGFDRVGVRIKGDGMRTTVLYTDTLERVLDFAASGMFVAFEDLSIVVYTNLSASTAAKIVNLVGVLGWYMNRVEVYVRSGGNENLGVMHVYAQDSYYGVMNACKTTTFAQQLPQGVKHAISGSTTFARLSGCHIYSKNNNALVVRDHTWGNPHRCMTLEDDDGVLVDGGSAEWFNQGFGFIGNSSLNVVRHVRFEAHPEVSHKYLGNDQHWLAKFGERTFDNVVDLPNANNLPVDNTRNGIVDLSGSNIYRVAGLANTQFSRSMMANASGSAAHSTVWTTSGTATITDVTADLPPDQSIVGAMQLAVTGNIAGATRAAFAVDPQRLNAWTFRYWAKRTAGQQQMRYMVESNVAGQYLVTDLSRSAITAHLLNGKTISLSGATWSGGVATYTTDQDNHWLVTGQNAGVSGMTPAGYNTAGQVTVLNATQFTLPVASNPGSNGGAGTGTRFSYDSEYTNIGEWHEVKGVFSVRRVVTGVSATGSQVTYTFDGPHRIPNNVGCQVKVWGLSIAGYNGTFNVVSTTSTTVTVTNATTGTPTAGFDGVALGFGGYFGNVTVRLGNEGSGSATWLIAGFSQIPGSDRRIMLSYSN